ncbi:MAG TPA: hypothetical protein VHR86_09385, partial [Armatimonadota bacterium]|nr:hypothetical protein [Armatimonadota bacterium]
KAALPAPAVLAIHGTAARGKESLLDPTVMRGHRLFPIELARRGYVVLAVDQYGFGGYLREEQCESPDAAIQASIKRFYECYPEWSLDGRRLLDLTRALDLLDILEYVQHSSGYGTIGNSLGGRGVIFLTALDERIGAAACSTGISTHANNVHRLLLGGPLLSRKALAEMGRTGQLPWEYHEMIALCAPRALMLIEPFNDDPSCNPDVYPNLQCFYQASKVYRFLGRPEHLSLYLHGDGHDLVDAVRDLAYDWLDRFLRPSGNIA